MGQPSLHGHLEHGLGRLAALAYGRPGRSLALVAVLVLLGLFLARNLSLNADLVDLLPRTFTSVQNIDRLEERFGGIGYVVVVGQDAEPEALQRFADDLAPRLEALPEIRFVEHRRAWQFFEEHALYYLAEQDLQTLADRVQDRLAFERRARNPMFVQLDDEALPTLDFSDIEGKYAQQVSLKLVGDGQDYYLDPDRRIVALLAKPASSAVDLDYAARLYAQVEEVVAGLDLAQYGPGFRVSYTGTCRKKLDQQRQITSDLGTASTVASILLLLYLLLHFRSLLSAALVLIPVSVGLVWTYAFVGVAYGQVNILTAFLGAILGGLGTEHGIHLLGRYAGERGEGAGAEQAVAAAFARTGSSALISAFVAALTFASLRISEFQAFREFGVIAALGMILTFVAYIPTLPAILGLAARCGWQPRRVSAVTGARSELARFLPRHARGVALGVAAVFGALILHGGQARFDYDFAALEDSRLESYQLDREVNRLLGYSQTPVVVLTDGPAEERAVVAELQRRIQAQQGRSTIDFVASLEDLVPPGQEAKHLILQQMASRIARVSPARLDAPTREALDRARRLSAARPFGVADIPATVRRQFQGVGADDSSFVLVFPAISLADGEQVQRFAAEVGELPLPGGRVIEAAGDALVLADIIAMVRREALPILLTALGAVLLALWLTLGRLRAAAICLIPTVVSILALVGLMPLAGLSFNYLNIVVVPVLIGTTVDAGVHLLSRFREAGGQFALAYGETGRAIGGGLLTSSVGFAAMLLADHPGLNSLGLLTNLGFAVNLVAMLLGFPALLFLLERRRGGARTAAPAADLADPVVEHPAPRK
ncbi:MAG: MMPL family transporter [Myxococcota bacterium]|jgi:predicted RND superfamily exporter protein|nr:MMPL family transporter [Myxococcota bacterium]